MQYQSGRRTVQEVVEKALRQLGWQGVHLQAAGRTDAGVHASGQVVAFDLEWKHSMQKLCLALNAHLPPDVAARMARPVHPDFNPRRSALSRTYRYHLFFEVGRDPLRERYAWRVWPPADPAKAQQAAEALIGRHDFAAFGSPPKPGNSTVRTVLAAGWQEIGSSAVFEVTADAFLYHMVRRMVGLLAAVGQSKYSLEDVRSYLDQPGGPDATTAKVQVMADPQGLFLTDVRYPAHLLAVE